MSKTIWTRCDWGTWALPLYITALRYPVVHGSVRHEYIVSVRVLCFGIFIEWSR